MLDIKRIKENPEEVKTLLRAKEVDCDAQVDRILELDKQRRELIASTEAKKAEQNKVSKDIPRLKKAGEDVGPIFKRMAELKASIAENDEALRDVEAEYRTAKLFLPNLPDPDLKAGGKESKEAAERIWYSSANDGYTGTIDHQHYNPTRYHGINLHAFFTKGTVEFRLFNGTTHAGKIKAYIQFCLAMSGWAIETNDNRKFFKDCSGYTQEQKAALMMRVLVNRLGMKGPEFKTARLHLTSAFTSNAQAA